MRRVNIFVRFRILATVFIAIVFLAPVLLSAQQGSSSTSSNPLDDLREEVKALLREAGRPFTDEQEKSIALMTEDRRQASEQLFGETMDFRGGPVQGQQMDRAVAAIQWMQTEFSKRLREYLTVEQLALWERHESEKTIAKSALAKSQDRQKQQTQFIRINNNNFTAEEGFFRGGMGMMMGGGGGGNRGPEVIERGGSGAFHGQGSVNLQDETLNARNPFASNKPPYQERQVSGNFSGPLIRNRLTINFSGHNNESQNVDTVHAIQPDGVFELGIVHPNTNRSAGISGTLQLTEKHSLIFNTRYGTNSQKNQFVGGFTLPERASSSLGSNSNFGVRQFSVISEQTLYETSFEIQRRHFRTKPLSEKVAVNVLDAFRAGGAQDKTDNQAREYNFSNLLTRMGSAWTLKAGIDGSYRTNHNYSIQNYAGTFTFSNLQDYVAGRPITYRITRGNPVLDLNQLEMSAFMQNDFKVNQRLTLMAGGRYDWQTNIADRNNIAPRFGFAYAMGRSLVIRGGSGVFYQRIQNDIIQQQRRFDGSRQYEIVVNNPSWPDPFQSGDVTVVPPSSIRVTDRDLTTPYNIVAQISVEKTFKNNLFLSVSYDRNRGVRQLRTRNLNAPFRGQTQNPDPTRGNVLNLESTALSNSQTLRLSARQRFSIFNLNASYSTGSTYTDSEGWWNLPADNYDLRADWGRAGWRQPYNLNTTINAQLPLGVFLTGSMVRNGGQPYNITTGADDNQDGQTNDRPAGGARNSANSPNFVSFNFNISKAIFFGERKGLKGSGTNLNLFANMNNAFNRTNYGTPSGVMTSPYFGRSFNARNPREIEAGLRFNF